MFGNPPFRWAIRALCRRDTRVAATFLGLLLLPVVLGYFGMAGDSAVPRQQSVIGAVSRNQSSSTLQPFDVSPLEMAIARDGDFPLAAEVFTSDALMWPAAGPITSYMDSTHPMGIDIGLDPGLQTPVVASARGTVTFAGGGDLDNYGFHVEIDHGGGLVTLYAHLSEILVVPGQTVNQGETIGVGGSTGKSSGKHLHFEVRNGDYLANPLDLLPEAPGAPGPFTLDCQTGLLAIDSGSIVHLEFARSLPQGTELAAASIRGLATGMPAPTASVVSSTAARIETTPRIGEVAPERFTLDLVIEGVRRYTRTCELEVRTLSSGTMVEYRDASHEASTGGSY